MEMTDKNMLKDEELDIISGGELKDNWRETIRNYAIASKERGNSYKNFKYDVQYGRFNSDIKNSQWLSKEDSLEINEFLESLRSIWD